MLPTSYIEYCPQIDEILRKNFNFDNLKMVRARNLVDGMVVPHRDFVEFKDSSKHYRVFLSIEENLKSYHSDDSGVFQMQRGEVWFLDAAIDHAAINFSTKSRMFLCLDFLLDPDLEREIIFNRDSIIDFSVKPTYRERKKISKYDIDKIIDHTSSLIDRSNFKDHLFSLSKFHFTYDVSVRENFDWLILATKNLEDKKLYRKATELNRYLLDQRELNERFVINEWN
ncbi:aspartyl/asparaginyl beta-hydroxylase domain-containing protein [Celerinatantimonas yamalensis]|uniref:Aspartyl/asparaginyl beta-hydroxylase domain-containing protein n=1 Tax=Celerinatantimonas yamalensis TaxID=559956 RepID=A0ABW9G961_9GAMM